MTICEPLLKDPDDRLYADWAAATARKAYGLIGSRWRMLVPEFELVPTTFGFRDIDEISNGLEGSLICEQDLTGMLVTTVKFADGAFRVYVGGEAYSGQDDELEGRMLYEFGSLIWQHCVTVRDAAAALARRPDVNIGEDEMAIAFKEAFVPYVRSPRTLKKREQYLHTLMSRIETLIEQGRVIPGTELAEVVSA